MQSSILKKYGPYLLNTPMGMLIGVLAGIILSWILSGDFGPEWSRLYTFVVTALISLGVASFAVAGVIANIQAQYERDEDARRRKLMAAKAFLPWTLSRLIEVAETGARMSEELGRNRNLATDAEFETRSTRSLTLSQELRDNLAEMIEHHDNEFLVRHIVSWLTEYQVYFARWQGNFEWDSPANLDSAQATAERTVDWVYLMQLASTMFGYARFGEDEMGEVTERGLRMATRRINGYRQLNEHQEQWIGINLRKYEREILGGV